MRLGTGPPGVTLGNLHTARRVTPISGEHLVYQVGVAGTKFGALVGPDIRTALGASPPKEGLCNRGSAVVKLKRTGGELRFCYEAGPCGYGIQRHLTAAGHDCVVVAPSLIPRKPGERIKTDRRDAVNLARLHRAGELTAVWVPDPAHEAIRDLVPADSGCEGSPAVTAPPALPDCRWV